MTKEETWGRHEESEDLKPENPSKPPAAGVISASPWNEGPRTKSGHLPEHSRQLFLDIFSNLQEMGKRMTGMSKSLLALYSEKEVKLHEELKASKAKAAEQDAKLVEYESTIRHLQSLLETVCSTQQAILACVDKEVKASIAKIEVVDLD